MAQASRTPYLILGLLAEGPASGYDIRRLTRLRFRFFWSESYGQIYPALRSLERRGLIARCEDGGRGLTRYTITPAGGAHLSAWLEQAAMPETARFEAVLKFYFSWAMSGAARKKLLADFRDRQAANISQLESFRKDLGPGAAEHPNHGIILKTIELGVATYRAWLDWAEGLLAQDGGRLPRGARSSRSPKSARGARSRHAGSEKPARSVRSARSARSRHAGSKKPERAAGSQSASIGAEKAGRAGYRVVPAAKGGR